jgi:hypothetical protein
MAALIARHDPVAFDELVEVNAGAVSADNEKLTHCLIVSGYVIVLNTGIAHQQPEPSGLPAVAFDSCH